MKTATVLSDEDLVEKAAKILVDKLGEVEASRFFSMAPKKREESVSRHRKWQKSLDKKAFFDEVFGQLK